nr:TetR/AcrR family transcriptional regulator [Paenibacillus turpanensis]
MPVNRRDAQETSDLILQAAADLFNRHGIEAVSMHQIAKAAGVGQGTLYRRYANKGDLCMELLKDSFLVFCSRLDETVSKMADEPAQERLYTIFRQLIPHTVENAKWIVEIQAHQRHGDPKPDFFQSEPYRILLRLITNQIEEIQTMGSTAFLHDPAFTAHILISSLSPHTVLHLQHQCGYTTDEISERFCASFIRPLIR